MTTLYRAADTAETRAGTCFARSLDDARCYLDNQGHGGSALWRCETDAPSVDIGSWPALESALADVLGDDEAAAVVQSCRDAGYGWAYEAIEERRSVREALAERWAWAVYEDTYPEQCETWQLLRAEALVLEPAE